MELIDPSAIHFSPYQLEPLAALNSRVGARITSRDGALLRLETQHGFGYADVHPWPELGDAPLAEQLRELAAGRLTALTRRSLLHAQADAGARAVNQSLFAGLQIPASHFLITSLAALNGTDLARARTDGFTHLKIKLGRHRSDELSDLVRLTAELQNFKLRFDFNAALEFSVARDFIRFLPQAVYKSIEFIEDPCAFSVDHWAQIFEQGHVSLALDRDPAPDPDHGLDRFDLVSALARSAFQWRVLKPAVQDIEALVRQAVSAPLPRLKFAVTTYMDHPVGQMAAAWQAALLDHDVCEVGVCGLLSHTAYRPNAYSDRLRATGPQLFSSEEVGIGFGDLLEREPWRRLAQL